MSQEDGCMVKAELSLAIQKKIRSTNTNYIRKQKEVGLMSQLAGLLYLKHIVQYLLFDM
jgi:hypothetical protein